MSYGMDARIGIAFQNSYGTANTASLHWLEPISEAVDLKKAQLKRKGLRRVYDEGGSQEGVNTIGGDLTIEAKANALGVLLAATNAETTKVTSGSLYTYTFNPRQSDAQALCPERPFTYLKHLGDSGSAHQYSNLNASNLELAISNGELLTAKISVVGGDYARIAAVSATYSDTSPLDWSVSSVSINGTGKTNVLQMTVSQENNITAKHTLDSAGDRFPTRLRRSDVRAISIAGTLVFDDQTEATLFINQTEVPMKLYLKGTALVSSGFYESLTVDVPAMRFTEMPLVVGGAGEVEVSFKADAKYHTGSATAITYTLQCGKAGF